MAKSLLSGLAIVDAKKPVNIASKGDPITKFLEGVVRQIGYIKDEIAGQPIEGTDGKKPRLWWWKKNGTYFVSIYYGTAPVDLNGQGMNSVQAGKELADALKVLETIKQAGEAGELTDVINKTAEEVSTRLHGKRKNKA